MTITCEAIAMLREELADAQRHRDKSREQAEQLEQNHARLLREDPRAARKLASELNRAWRDAADATKNHERIGRVLAETEHEHRERARPAALAGAQGAWDAATAAQAGAIERVDQLLAELKAACQEASEADQEARTAAASLRDLGGHATAHPHCSNKISTTPALKLIHYGR